MFPSDNGLVDNMSQLMVVLGAFLVLTDAAFFESEWTSPDQHYRIKQHCLKKKHGVKHRGLGHDKNGLSRSLFIGGDNEPTISPQIKISSVSITTCPKSARDPLQVDFKILGDTLLPGYANLAFNISSEFDITDEIVVEVEASKIILGDHVRLPCINNMGSCSYTKQCKNTEQPNCTDEFIREKIPCSCPVPQGQFHTDNFKLFVGITEITDIPGWLTDGRYAAEILIRSGEQRLTCLNAEMDIKKL